MHYVRWGEGGGCSVGPGPGVLAFGDVKGARDGGSSEVCPEAVALERGLGWGPLGQWELQSSLLGVGFFPSPSSEARLSAGRPEPCGSRARSMLQVLTHPRVASARLGTREPLAPLSQRNP